MVKQAKSLNQALLQAMDIYSEKTCFYVRRGRRFQRISYGRFLKLTFRLTNFFHQQEIAAGERVAIIADNPLEWMVVYVACLLAGLVVVPLRAWLPPKTLQVMVRDSGACLALVQGKGQSQIITEAGRALPDLKNVLAVEEETKTKYPEVIPITTILAKAISAKEAEAIRTRAANIGPQALALIYYKTHHTQGVVFDHARRLATMQAMTEWFTLDDDDVAISTLLSWSLYTLDSALHYFLSGIPHVLNEGAEMLGVSLTQTTPTVNLTTPSGFEEFYDQILAEVHQWPPARQALFQWALAIGKEYRATGLAASEELRGKYIRADRTVFSRLRSQYGGTTITRIYSTGAPLPTQWAEFGEIIGGFNALNIYSLTEAGGFPAVNRPGDNRPDSCGQVAPGFQVRIADDGEVWVRGASLMCGYWQRPEETQKVLDADGWLRTGDLGHFDKDGYLYLTGNKEASLLLSSGRKVMPATLRNPLVASPYISQVAVFGEGRPYVSALIVPNLATIAAEVGEHTDNGQQPAITVAHPTVTEIVDNEIAEVNSHLDRWTQIREYRLLAQPFTEAAGELTDSQKICYEVVVERYAAEIESMYPMTMPVSETTASQVQLDLEELRELLEKQDLLDAWLGDAGIGFLFDLAGDKQIDLPSMLNICDTAAAISQMQSEEKPLSTALVVGDPVRITRVLPESEIQLHRYDHIRRMRQIVISMAKMVDGMVLGYVLDKQGHVQGVHKLEVDLDAPANFLLGPQFRHHAAISQQCNAVVLFVPSGGRQVRVFAEGQLVGRYSNGNWSSENIADIDQSITRLAEHKSYSLSLLQRVLSCAFQMSEKNLGAIFILGDGNAILQRSDPPEISAFATIASADMDKLSDRELINFAKQDGATVIDVDGKFRGCMVLLRPDANTQAEIGPGKGARHSSAAKMSAEVDCLAIVVSQDGPITLYDSGQRVMSL